MMRFKPKTIPNARYPFLRLMLAILFLGILPCLATQSILSLSDQVIALNIGIQNQTSTKSLIKSSQQKEELFKAIASNIAQGQVPDISDLDIAIEELQNALENSIQNPYTLALNSLHLRGLLTKRTLMDCAKSLAKKDRFLTTHAQARTQIGKCIQHIKSNMRFQGKELQDLNPQQALEFKKQKNDFDLRAGSYLEILTFLDENVELILPDSLWSSFDLALLLQKTTALLPQDFQSLLIVKLLFSSAIFAFFFLLRHPLARLLLKSISLLSSLLKSQEIQERIKAQISLPLLWIIFLISLNLSLEVLSFPSPLSPKLKIWINACFIISLSWLTILLFKGYGVAIIGAIAEKNNNFRREVINLLLKVIYFFIILIAILLLLKNFGFNISALIASLGIGGLAVAFAIKDILANFFASIFLLFDNSFNQGDWIVCGDVEGTVVEIGLRRTTIRTFDNALLFVPNSLLANGSVRNWNRRKSGRRIRFQVGVTYSATSEQIKACIRDIQAMLLAHPQIAKDCDDRQNHQELELKKSIISIDDLLGYKSNLFVVLDEFAGSSINILIYCFSKTTVWGEWLAVREDVMLKVMEILDRHGLSFAFPSQSLYIEKLPPTGALLSQPPTASQATDLDESQTNTQKILKFSKIFD